jgi:hypothetical protein
VDNKHLISSHTKACPYFGKFSMLVITGAVVQIMSHKEVDVIYGHNNFPVSNIERPIR